MRLEILDPENELDRDFGFWLLNRIKMHFNAEVDPRKLTSWNKFFEESEDYTSIYGTPIDSLKILETGINNLLVRKLPDMIVISMNKNKFVPGLDRIRVDTVCRLITFGNTSVKGYPVLLDTLQHFADNINEYIDLYDEGIM